MNQSLRSFIDLVARARPGDIKAVTREVDPKFEIPAVVEKLETRKESPMVIFKNVKGSKLPVLINLAASYERLALALDTEVHHLADEYARREENRLPVKEVSEAPVKEVVFKGKDVDLTRLPIVTHNERDAAAYITAGPLIVKDPDTGAFNCGLYRLQLQEKDQMGLFINPHNHAYLIGERYAERNELMEVAVVIGHHPAFLMSSLSRLEGFGGELEVAGGLLDEPLEVIKAETVNLLIPSQAEIVIEGVVDPKLKREEGPFGEWPRYYTGTGKRWYVKVNAIAMRADAIYQDIFAAHNEHNMIGAVPKMGSLCRRVKGALPTVRAVNLPLSGGGRARCYISLKKRSDGEPKQAAFEALVTEPNIKHLVLVDDDVDVFNEEEVLWALSTRFQADKDLIIMPGCIGSHLIPTAYDATGLGHGVMETKLIFDATKPAPPTRFPVRDRVPQKILDRIEPEEYLEDYHPL
ncbi:MAG: UbiD family decarboxylase [Candidatus Aerophobus sp.]|nr:MAG: UbiD family decarboxylase [Candidatus Aerophobus sp.]